MDKCFVVLLVDWFIVIVLDGGGVEFEYCVKVVNGVVVVVCGICCV